MVHNSRPMVEPKRYAQRRNATHRAWFHHFMEHIVSLSEQTGYTYPSTAAAVLSCATGYEPRYPAVCSTAGNSGSSTATWNIYSPRAILSS